MKPGAFLTPGRVSWVYFTHKDAMELLADKPRGWNKVTSGGRYRWLDLWTVQPDEDYVALPWSKMLSDSESEVESEVESELEPESELETDSDVD